MDERVEVMLAFWLGSLQEDSVGRILREGVRERGSVRGWGCPPIGIILYLEGLYVRVNCPCKNWENCLRNIKAWRGIVSGRLSPSDFNIDLAVFSSLLDAISNGNTIIS